MSRWFATAGRTLGSSIPAPSSVDMPPFLALSACLVVVLVLLWVEHRCEAYSSWVLLLPTTWFLIVASRPLSNWFMPTGSPAISFEEGSAPDRLVLSGLIGLALVLLFRRGRSRNLDLASHWSLFLLLGFVALSVFWSDSVFVSLKRWVRLFGAVPISL